MNSRDAFIERDLSSVTSGETDADVSSFLDQALLEEDMKMSPPQAQHLPVSKHDVSFVHFDIIIHLPGKLVGLIQSCSCVSGTVQ